MNLTVTLLDSMDVTLEEVQRAGHGGVGCECQLCSRLKNIEDDWIMRLGTFYYPGGLNKRDEIKKKVRSGYYNLFLCQYGGFVKFMVCPSLFFSQQLCL